LVDAEEKYLGRTSEYEINYFKGHSYFDKKAKTAEKSKQYYIS
jgi:hypothetical protein